MRPSGQHRCVDWRGRGLGLALGAQGMVLELDVTDARSVSAVATAVGCDLDAIDLLINAAGVEDSPASGGPLAALERDALISVFACWSISPTCIRSFCRSPW